MDKQKKLFNFIIKFNTKTYYFYSYKIPSLKDILKFFNFSNPLIIVECNGKICSPQKWNDILVSNKFHINLITIVGGG